MKLNYLQLRKLRVLTTMAFLGYSVFIYAQPANDKCSGAISIGVASDINSCVWTNGTTLNTTDGALDAGPVSPCSVNFVRDDVWYKLSIPANSNEKLVTIKVEVGSQAGDMPAVGMAVYSSLSCAANGTPFSCTNFNVGDDAKIELSSICNQELLIRVWSAAGGAGNTWTIGQGNFRICAYLKDEIKKTPTLWGANGEGSFDGGLNGWTTGGDLCGNNVVPTFPLWQWRQNGDSHGPLWGGQVINSHTACNGAMLFDSDFFDNAGTGGICPTIQQGWLESPLIDVSSFNVAGITLEFRQRVTQFLSQYFIDYSPDNGGNWYNVQINQDIDAFNSNTPPGINPTVDEIRRVSLPFAVGSSQLKIRFRAIANYYYWLIDDVKIVERESYNLAVNNFYAIAPNKLWQKDQLEGFGGMADIANKGAKTATNSNLTLKIKDAGSNIIWTDNFSYGNVIPDTVIQNLPMTGTFTFPNNTLGTYTGVYTMSCDSTDFDLTDNTQTFDWTVTDTTMSKEDNVILGSGVRASAQVNFTWGNIYHIVNRKSAAGNPLIVNYASVGVANPDSLKGASLYLFLYRWNNQNLDGIIQNSEVTTVGFNQIDFTGSDTANTLFTVPMFDFNTLIKGVLLEDNTDYILVMQYSAPADNTTLQCFINSDANIDYSAYDLRTAINLPSPRFSQVLDVGNTGTLTPGTFVGGNAPVLRMHIAEIFPDATSEPKLDPSNKLVIAPNPVKDQLNLNIDLVKESPKATIEIMEMSGRIIQSRVLRNIKSNIEAFNTTNLVNGSYILNYISENGKRSLKFIISR